MERRSVIRRVVLAVAALGIAVTMMAAPVRAHFIENTTHLGVHIWQDFLKAQTLKLFYTKGQSDARFVNTSELWFAKVDADPDGANLLAGRGVDAVSRIASGAYLVDFAGDVSACGWTATLQDNAAGSSQPGEISVEINSALAPDILRVKTYSSAGTPTDQADTDGFSIVVTC